MGVVKLVSAAEEWEKVHFSEPFRVWRREEVDRRLRQAVAELRDERKGREGSGSEEAG